MHSDSSAALTDWDVGEEFTFAPLVLTADVLVIYVVEVVLLVSMAAEALACRSNSFAVSTCLHIAPVGVQTIGALLPNVSLVLLKLSLTHHLATIVMTHDSLVLKVCLHMLGRITA